MLKKYQRELDRFATFCEKRGRYALADVTLPDLTDFRATWEQEYPSSRTRQKVQGRLRGFFRYSLNAGFIPKNTAAALSAIKWMSRSFVILNGGCSFAMKTWDYRPFR